MIELSITDVFLAVCVFGQSGTMEQNSQLCERKCE